MSNKRTSIFDNGLIWFGAGVSIAEILTGTYFAPLGMAKGLAAILIGHGIGCVLLFLAGYIGALSRRSSMETTKISFGNKGGLLFAFLNVLQLVGWTAIMIYDGALAAGGIFGIAITATSNAGSACMAAWMLAWFAHSAGRWTRKATRILPSDRRAARAAAANRAPSRTNWRLRQPTTHGCPARQFRTPGGTHCL